MYALLNTLVNDYIDFTLICRCCTDRWITPDCPNHFPLISFHQSEKYHLYKLCWQRFNHKFVAHKRCDVSAEGDQGVCQL